MLKRFLSVTFAALLLGFVALGTAQDIEGRTLEIGSDTTYPPFETVNEDGEIVGFDVDVMSEICDRLGCEPVFVTTAWDGIFPALAAGEFDMVASGVTITEERDRIVDFTIPYYEVDQAVAVRVEDDDLTIDDFVAEGGELLIGAQTGTTNAITAEELVGRDRLRLYDDFNAAVQGLLNDDVDGVMIDDVVADEFVEQYAGELSVSIRGVESGDQLGFAVPEGSALVDDLSEGIRLIQDDGTLDELIARWFTASDD